MSFAEIGAWLSHTVALPELSPMHLLAYVAGAAGVGMAAAGALVRTMIPLRWLAVGSNIGLLLFGALHPSLTTFAVAAVLLPINLYRLREMVRLTRQVTAAEADSKLSGLWLRPYMKAQKLSAGQVLFRRGDKAHTLYLLVSGQLELAEIGREIPTGRIFGEIALFSPSKRRTHTARAVTPCTVLWIDESTVKQLYHQNPAFGFHLITLVAARLSDDAARATPGGVPSAHGPEAAQHGA